MSVLVTTNTTLAPANQELRLLRIYLSNFLPTAVSHEIPALANVTLIFTEASAATASVQRIDQVRNKLPAVATQNNLR